MIRFRHTYWSCTKIADKVRGVAKPKSATSEDWHQWRKDAKKKHPVRFWIAEELLDGVQDFINWPADFLKSVTVYINNRWVTKSHLCETGLKAGEWHELDQKLMHGMFNELVKFVEQDKAWMEFISHKESRKTMPWYHNTWPFSDLIVFRNKEMGLKYLEWEQNLYKDIEYFGGGKWSTQEEIDEIKARPDFGHKTDQAKAADAIAEMYRWWTEVRPARLDPHEASGWSDYCDRLRQRQVDEDEHDVFYVLSAEKTEEEREEASRLSRLTDEIEAQYNKEDDEMLAKLLSIRRHLWT